MFCMLATCTHTHTHTHTMEYRLYFLVLCAWFALVRIFFKNRMTGIETQCLQHTAILLRFLSKIYIDQCGVLLELRFDSGRAVLKKKKALFLVFLEPIFFQPS